MMVVANFLLGRALFSSVHATIATGGAINSFSLFAFSVLWCCRGAGAAGAGGSVFAGVFEKWPHQ